MCNLDLTALSVNRNGWNALQCGARAATATGPGVRPVVSVHQVHKVHLHGVRIGAAFEYTSSIYPVWLAAQVPGALMRLPQGGTVGQRDRVMEVLRRRDGHDRILLIPAAFVALTGDLYSAALLSQLLYWTDRAASPAGWVYKTRREWLAELSGTRYTIDNARTRLRDLDLIEEEIHLANNRRTLHLRLKVPRLLALLQAGEPVRDPSPAEPRTRRALPAATPAPPPPAPAKASLGPLREPRGPLAGVSLLHRERLLARLRQQAAEEEAPARRDAPGSPTCCSPAHLCAAGQPTGVPEVETSKCRPSQHRSAERRPFEVPVCGISSITETSSEISTKISAQTSSRGRNGEGEVRRNRARKPGGTRESRDGGATASSRRAPRSESASIGQEPPAFRPRRIRGRLPVSG